MPVIVNTLPCIVAKESKKTRIETWLYYNPTGDLTLVAKESKKTRIETNK